jgi:hypothetical protein
MPINEKIREPGETRRRAENRAETKANGRLRFWEFDGFLTCPVAEICLTRSEQKQVLKKSGFSFNKKSAFEIHEAIVAGSDCENKLSRKVENLLFRKFKRDSESFESLDPKELMQKWRDLFKTGNYQVILWEIASRPGFPAEFRREVFGNIHMAMHKNAEDQAGLKRQLAEREKSMKGLRESLRNAREARRALKKEKDRLSAEKASSERRVRALEQEQSRLQQFVAEISEQDFVAEVKRDNDRLRVRVAELEALTRAKDQEMTSLREQNTSLASRLDKQRDVNNRLKTEIEAMMARLSAFHDCDRDCPVYDLCNKRILMVGGITRMKSLYRKLVEGSNGLFEHHDGSVKNGVKNLEGQFKRSDVIVCPVSCNSHNACSLVKKLGKKYQKPVFMLPNSSLNAVAEAIWNHSQPNAEPADFNAVVRTAKNSA